jgi:hypothetical protein
MDSRLAASAALSLLLAGCGSGSGCDGPSQNSSASAACTGVADGTQCALDGSDNFHEVKLSFDQETGRFSGSIVTNLCSNDAYGFCAQCDPPQQTPHKHTAQCTEQRFPAFQGPAAAPLRGRVGLSVFGVNIYGPEEAGFGQQGTPAPCTDGSGECPAGMDVPTCEDSLDVTCGSSSKVQHSLMLDTCGGHAMPYHYHQDNACDYDHQQAGHSPLIGFALDGYGIYGLYESNPSKPEDLDACNGHVGLVPANASYGVPNVSVYHYHVTSSPPYTLGCFGEPSGVSVDQCKALYPPSSASGRTGACDDGTVAVTISNGTSYCYDLDCPCFYVTESKLGRNSYDTSCLTDAITA